MKPLLARALHFIKPCLALFLLSRSSCFYTLLFHSFTRFASLFNRTFYVFLLLILLIFFIFSLSDRDQLSRRKPHPVLHATAAPGTPHYPSPPLHQTFFPRLVDQSPVPALDKTPKATSRSLTTVSCNNVSDNIDCYRRVRSENFSCRIVVGGSPELNGLNAVARYGGELGRRLCSLDNLSEEDFNNTVEEYIAMQKRMLRQELAE